jgi:predicted PurR-regulated permease PerM
MKLRWPGRPKMGVVMDPPAPAAHPTPIAIAPRTRSILLLGAGVLLILLLWRVPSISMLILGGGALALVLSFPVRLLSHTMPRGAAILASLLLSFGALVMALVVVVPIIAGQLRALVEQLPGIAESLDQRLPSLLEPLEQRGLLPGTPREFISNLERDLFAFVEGLGSRILGGLGGVISSAFGTAILIFGIVFIAVYLLVDARRLEAAFLRAAPHAYRRDALELWHAFSFTLSRYLGGLGLSLLIQGALSAAALYLLGVPYAVLLGAWVAVTAILPYIGAWIGSIPAVLLALSVSPTTALLTALLFVAIQQFESNLLTPQIQSQAVRVHPILVLLAVIAGGELAGIPGVIFAVPVLAVLRVLFDFFRARLRIGPLPAARSVARRGPAASTPPSARSDAFS